MTEMHKKWEWPENAMAAVTLSYDDGMEDNLEYAIPDLESAGFRGTFYLTVGFPFVRKRAAEWRAAFERGHEIGNHTVRHISSIHGPAGRGAKGEDSELWLEQFSADDILREVGEAARWLTANIGPDPDRTFCHPCGSVAIGDPPDEALYDAAIRRYHFAARPGGRLINDPSTMNLLRIQGFNFMDPTVEEIVDYCEKARATGGWASLVFHSIEGPNHHTARDVHKDLLKYLKKEPYWVAPVKTVARYVQRRRANSRFR